MIACVRVAYEVGLFFLFVVVMVRSLRARGAGITARELAFGFVVSQGVELLAVALGRYRYPDWLLYFPPRPAWVPLAIGLGWAALLPCLMRISERILGTRAPRWQLATLDGAMGVGLDLVLDPAVSGEPLHMWLWSGAGMTKYRLWLLDVPVFNFVGWFLLVAACSLQLRAVEGRAGGGPWLRLFAFAVADLGFAVLVMMLPW